ncbi:MAG TPA: chromosome partitioning protein ParB, partial [Cyanobacteria bacterium UBA11148]|nr:chromosome partitioning protein ParB [Cyanobacteria bacterium UBA11148]
LLVRPRQGTEEKYELVAGERRWHAAQKAGLDEVPVVVKDLSDEDSLVLALIENLQREDLNPFEETEGILQLLSLKLSRSQSEVISLLQRMHKAKMVQVKRKQQKGHSSANSEVGESDSLWTNILFEEIEKMFQVLGTVAWQSFVTARLPLLNLPEEIKQAIR